MRLILAIASFCILISASAEEPSVEVLGVTLFRGMSEADVRAVFPNVNCASKGPAADPSIDLCSISDGVPPGVDGEVTFKEGRLLRASRNWFLPDDSSPYDALQMQNEILTRLAGEETGACAKIETYSSRYSKTAIFAFPEKVLSVQMHTLRGNSVFFRESLRINPVPKSYKVRGNKMQGDEWCAYIN